MVAREWTYEVDVEHVEVIASREMHDGRFSMPRNFVFLTTFALAGP